MDRTYEEHFSQIEAMTPAEEKFMYFLREKFPEPYWNEFANVKQIDKELQMLLDDLKEEFYLAGKQYQKQEDKRKAYSVIDGAYSITRNCPDYCLGSCSKCSDYGKEYGDLMRRVDEYFE